MSDIISRINEKKVWHYIPITIIVGVLSFIIMNVCLGAASGHLASSYKKKLLEQKVSYVEKQCEILANQILINGISTYRMADVSDSNGTNVYELEQLANDLDGRIMIIDQHFEILADTYHQHCGRYFMSKDLFRAFQGEKVQYKYIGDSGVQVVTNVYDYETRTLKAVIVAAVSLQSCQIMENHMNTQRDSLAGVFLLVSLVLSVLLSLFLHRFFRKTQKQLDIIAEGHQEEGLREEGFRESYQFARSFNRIINRYKELENSRQEFVSNVSHELKTPITSMKILADSLLSQEKVPVELYEEFMGDIVHEIDRENQIITDLLSLVKMDKTKADLNITSVNIYELLESISKRIVPIAEERGITIRLETMRHVVAEVDAGKISLAFNNLIENAVKYNNDGGRVDVSLNADHKFFYVRVKDTGVGIPEECQEQIFERFYRVDKARSRETGGTGLGLAIARNVILMHKGSIRVHSKEGEGSTFTVRIPMNYVG